MRKPIKLQNNKITHDVRLDRLVQFDRRSRKFPIKELIVEKKPRSYTWRCNTVLDQGNIGQCVGFGCAAELIARPAEAKGIDYNYAHMIYNQAQKIDEWPGEEYEGTSVLAGVKVLKGLGWCEEYRWGFSLLDLQLGVAYNGPAILGLDWLTGMMETDSKGFIHATGYAEGGHCILCRAINVTGKYFTLRNSWGTSWGVNGDCKISFSDMDYLLGRQGESCFLIKRRTTI